MWNAEAERRRYRPEEFEENPGEHLVQDFDSLKAEIRVFKMSAEYRQTQSQIDEGQWFDGIMNWNHQNSLTPEVLE